MWGLWLAPLALYRPANFIRSQSVVTLKNVQNSLNTTFFEIKSTPQLVYRSKIVQTSADDIVFDAACGSRQGRIVASKLKEKTSLYRKKLIHFEQDLLKAQIFVTCCQTLYLLFQLSGISIIIKILSDITLN